MNEPPNRLRRGHLRTFKTPHRVDMTRVPSSAHDAMIIALVAFDKLMLLAGEALEMAKQAELAALLDRIAALTGGTGPGTPCLADKKG